MKKRLLRTFSIVLAVIISLSVSLSVTSQAYAIEGKDKEIESRVEEILKSMTLSEKIAQMLLVSIPKQKPQATQEKWQFGGYILFADSFEKSTPTKIRKKIKGIQKVSKANMFIAVDEEGGTVVRVSKFKQFRKTPYKSPREVYKAGDWQGIQDDARWKSNFLKNLEINTNLAPVADVAYSKKDYIYSRAFSTSASSTSKFIRLSVTEMNKRNCVSTLKHFPGYGNNGDTHKDVIVDKHSKEDFESKDLKPFEAGIKAGVPMIMVNHNIVKCFDSKNTASMSYKVHKYLREEMGFDGIIVTDSLGMSGVKNKYGSKEEIAVKAVKAGNDMLCTPYGITSRIAIRKAVMDGEIKESRIDSSVRRILRVKLKYGIIK